MTQIDAKWCWKLSVRHQATQTVNTADVIHKNTVQMQANRHESERVWAVVCQLTVIVWSCVHPALGLEGGCAVWEAAFNAERWRPANDVDSNTQTARQPNEYDFNAPLCLMDSSLIKCVTFKQNKSICYHIKCCLGCNRSSSCAIFQGIWPKFSLLFAFTQIFPTLSLWNVIV